MFCVRTNEKFPILLKSFVVKAKNKLFKDDQLEACCQHVFIVFSLEFLIRNAAEQLPVGNWL